MSRPGSKLATRKHTEKPRRGGAAVGAYIELGSCKAFGSAFAFKASGHYDRFLFSKWNLSHATRPISTNAATKMIRKVVVSRTIGRPFSPPALCAHSGYSPEPGNSNWRPINGNLFVQLSARALNATVRKRRPSPFGRGLNPPLNCTNPRPNRRGFFETRPLSISKPATRGQKQASTSLRSFRNKSKKLQNEILTIEE